MEVSVAVLLGCYLLNLEIELAELYPLLPCYCSPLLVMLARMQS